MEENDKKMTESGASDQHDSSSQKDTVQSGDSAAGHEPSDSEHDQEAPELQHADDAQQEEPIASGLSSEEEHEKTTEDAPDEKAEETKPVDKSKLGKEEPKIRPEDDQAIVHEQGGVELEEGVGSHHADATKADEQPEGYVGSDNVNESSEEIEYRDAAAAAVVNELEVRNNEEESADINEAAESIESKSETGQQKEDEDHSHDEEGGHDDDEQHLDYSHYSKTQLVQVLESQLKDTDFKQIGNILKEIKSAFDEIYNTEKEEAYNQYLQNGGEPDGFEYNHDDLDNRFFAAYNTLRDKRAEYLNNLANQKERNLEKKQALLERLREMVDSDETVTSIKELKDIQEEWKNTGPVPPQQLKSLWANYNALIDRYYDQRSIYFELKELDRKKNFELKLELCERAEQLAQEENLKEAIKALNELHEEFKHIGPVPKEEQEPLWQRFKAASDAVYARRKQYYEGLKEQLTVNQQAKEALAERVQPFAEFDSERISDWNAKTKEILALQKEWESIGGLPRESAKAINKKFWSAFKGFFNNKGKFFKKIEAQRQENFKKKEALLERAEELKDSEDFSSSAQTLKDLQKEWKEIGPVPEKFRNEIYAKFKAACDHFFDRKRANEADRDKDFFVNLKKKQEICEDLEQMVQNDDVDIDKIDEYLDAWPEIGFVPKANIKSIQERFNKAVSNAVDKTDLEEDEKQRLKYTAQFSKLKQSPNSKRILQKKENSLRRQIAKLENDIVLWKNNLSFFAESKQADKLKDEFNEKIDKATKELESLEEQLRAIHNIED